MKFGFISRTGFVAPQVFQVSDRGYICRVAFLQSNGSIGAFSEVDVDQKWEGLTFNTLQDCLDAIKLETMGKPA